MRFATQLCRHYPDKAQGWCILGDAAAHSARCKLAMAAYHNCWGRSHDAKVRKYCLQVSGSDQDCRSFCGHFVVTAEQKKVCVAFQVWAMQKPR